MTFPPILDARGALCVAERLPFPIRRVYWIWGVSKGAARGGHSHKALRRIMVALHGGVTIKVDGVAYRLDEPSMGMYIAPMEWIELVDFEPGTAVMVLASEEYDESDYIRDYDQWTTLRRA